MYKKPKSLLTKYILYPKISTRHNIYRDSLLSRKIRIIHSSSPVSIFKPGTSHSPFFKQKIPFGYKNTQKILSRQKICNKTNSNSILFAVFQKTHLGNQLNTYNFVRQQPKNNKYHILKSIYKNITQQKPTSEKPRHKQFRNLFFSRHFSHNRLNMQIK